MLNLKNLLFDKQYIKLCAYLVVTALVFYILYSVLSNINSIFAFMGTLIMEILSALAPLIYGLIIAYFFSPLVNLIDYRLLNHSHKKPSFKGYTLAKQIEKKRRTLSIAMAFIIVIIIFSLLSYTLYSMIIGKVTVEKIDTMSENIISYFSKYQELFNTINDKLASSGLADKIKNPLEIFFDWLSSGFFMNEGNITGWLSSIGSNLLNVLLGLVIAFYLLKDQEFFLRLWRKILSSILPNQAKESFLGILKDIHAVISKFFRGQLLDGLIVGILSSIGLFIVGIDFAIFIGMFAGIANVIPYFGPIIGTIPAVSMALLDGSISKALLSVIVLLGIQQVDGAVIAPRVVGKSVGLHPVFVLLAVIIGGKYFGIIGMLAAVPTAAILKLFIIRFYESNHEIDEMDLDKRE